MAGGSRRGWGSQGRERPRNRSTLQGMLMEHPGDAGSGLSGVSGLDEHQPWPPLRGVGMGLSEGLPLLLVGKPSLRCGRASSPLAPAGPSCLHLFSHVTASAGNTLVCQAVSWHQAHKDEQKASQPKELTVQTRLQMDSPLHPDLALRCACFGPHGLKIGNCPYQLDFWLLLTSQKVC